MKVLRNFEVGFESATEPLSRIASPGLSFHELYGELEAVLKLNKEAKLAAMRDSMRSRRNQADQGESKITGILHAGRGKCASQNKGKSKRASQKRND